MPICLDSATNLIQRRLVYTFIIQIFKVDQDSKKVVSVPEKDKQFSNRIIQALNGFKGRNKKYNNMDL